MSLVQTRIQNIRANADIDKYEIRPSRYGAFDCFMEQTKSPISIISPELAEKARRSIGAPALQIPVINYDSDVTISNTRSAVITDDENTSALVNVTFATYSFGFTMVPVLYMNNEIGYQRDFTAKLMKYIYALGKTLDGAALTALNGAKTQTIDNSLLYNFDSSTHILGATWNQRENLLGDLGVMAQSNDFFNQLHIIGDAGCQSLVMKLAQKDIYNAVNKRNEWADKVFHFTNSIASKANTYAQGYAINEGSVGVLTRFERECLVGGSTKDGHEWGISTLPVLNLECGTYYYEDAGDYSGIAGAASADMTRVRKEHYAFAVDVAFITAYNSHPAATGSGSSLVPAKASPFIKFEVGSTGAVYGDPVVLAGGSVGVEVTNPTTSPVNTKEVQ